MATNMPNFSWEVSSPRLFSPSSRMSSWMSDAVWMNSMPSAASSARSMVPPFSSATSNSVRGLSLLPGVLSE